MFFSTNQIRQSVQRLNTLNPFFGTAFLALKRVEIPIGSMKQLVFSRVVDEILQNYYRPVASFNEFYTPFKSSSPKDRWNGERYASTTMQRITVDTFGDVFIHLKGSQQWGWKENYITILVNNHLYNELIPVFDLAVWIFRDREWYDGIDKSSVVEFFFVEFKIRKDERVLFESNLNSSTNFSDWLQPNRITTNELLDIIGDPPDSTLGESATLSSLKLISVGPVRELAFEPSTRLNIITGDNGLGKTFLLDCTWWALTGSWASNPAYPHNGTSRGQPAISFIIDSGKRLIKNHSKYIKEKDFWSSSKRNALPGLSIYARADGSFAIWDPAKRRLIDDPESYDGSDPQIEFSKDEVLFGKTNIFRRRKIIVCQGLIKDWLDWQYREDIDKRNL